MSKKWQLYALMLNAYWAGVMVSLAARYGGELVYLIIAAINVAAVAILGGLILEDDK